MATTINFDTLIFQGVLEGKGTWYKVLNCHKLPENAKAKACETKTNGTVVMVKFSKVTKATQHLLDKLSV